MSKPNVQYAGGGMGLASGMFLAFLVLKLTGFIGWSWWWVTAPLWISWALVLFILLVFVAVMAVLWFYAGR